MGKHYIKRGDWYYYLRRVPKKIKPYDSRKNIRIALQTKNENEAIRLVGVYNEFVEKYWADLVKTGSFDQEKDRFKKAKAIVETHGFAYKNMTDILSSPITEIISRVKASEEKSMEVVDALFGNVEEPSTTLSECIELYWPLCADRLVTKTKHEVIKFKNPRRLAWDNFIEVTGDISLKEITQTEINNFRNTLLKQIEQKELTANTCNKKLFHVKDILRTVGSDLEISTDFEKLFVKKTFQEIKSSRPSYEYDFVQATFIDNDCLSGLNNQARAIAEMMIETGARDSEITGLLPEDFYLDAEIPYIHIRENHIRGIKNEQSSRLIPLVGISLQAAKKIHQTGFDRYWNNVDSASSAINKYLNANGLKPSPKHSLYSLRHTFKDRLRDAGAPEEVIDELMGHKKAGPKYGRGHTLETKEKWLKKIAFSASK